MTAIELMMSDIRALDEALLRNLARPSVGFRLVASIGVTEVVLDRRPMFAYRIPDGAYGIIMRCDGGDPGDEDPREP